MRFSYAASFAPIKRCSNRIEDLWALHVISFKMQKLSSCNAVLCYPLPQSYIIVVNRKVVGQARW
jgi:hypothetical protein